MDSVECLHHAVRSLEAMFLQGPINDHTNDLSASYSPLYVVDMLREELVKLEREMLLSGVEDEESCVLAEYKYSHVIIDELAEGFAGEELMHYPSTPYHALVKVRRICVEHAYS